MDAKKIMQIFNDTAYIHAGGTEAELRCAEYLKGICTEMGLNAVIDPFKVDMGTIQQAEFYCDGVSIPCTGFMLAGSGEVEAPFYYLRNTDKYSLSQCRGKIVMVDGRVGYWLYKDLLANGALGFVTYDGNVLWADNEIEVRELRSYVSEGVKIPAVHLQVKDAVKLIEKGVTTAKIVLKQDEYEGESRNVIVDLPGERKETIVFTAHYDSTPLSFGAYDNMSGSVGLLSMMEYFSKNPHSYSMRFILCGSEERGLLGSKAYCANHEDQLGDIVLCINLDMIGCIMGKFIACCTSEDKLVHYLSYMGDELGFSVKSYQDVYSSDSTPFADRGIPAVSFARIAPPNTANIHHCYDTVAAMKGEQMVEDIDFITAFAARMANAKHMPVARVMPDNMKEKLDYYLMRKRRPEN